MGSWGAGILDDDFARDVSDSDLDAIRAGQSAAEPLASVGTRFAKERADADQEAVAWRSSRAARGSRAG